MERVVVGLSGGIDSAVALFLLQKAGYSCVGVQMRYWAEQPEVCDIGTNRFTKAMFNKCCSDESMLISRRVCAFLGVPFYAHDVQETFYENIVDPYLKDYNEGLTPNPCTHCNKTIKFGALMDFADSIGASYVATGHYARLVEREGIKHIAEAKDPSKDQSYFLYALSNQQRARILLPLGEMQKTQVKQLAEEVGLSMFKKSYKESQGLCFFPERTPDAFLERHASPAMRTSGPMIDQKGRVLGTHKGLAHYTVGQRRGIDLGGLPEPYFVIERKIEENTVVIGPKQYLYTTEATLDKVTLTSKETTPKKVQVRIRYRMEKAPALLDPQEDGHATLRFLSPVFAITPGQIAVLYDENTVIGGARIRSTHITP
ncbi:tRNA 2-thiouridine(34) synthase MnmA [Candidatus Gracilibacteria bacterium CG17_big_fil_post_rev_8_21_14_2_50_48_13]|nr:MAG: tRNA 2-thiouridine(34) synthase MnmA [Candidatus Gracilibacteria bacterium CG17_big_fil_post_rev_8_21_14_2_50_48_13]